MDEFSATVLDAIDHAVVAVDTRLTVVVWNRAVERATGLSRAAAVGRSVESLAAHLPDVGLVPALRRALDGETVAPTEVACAIPGDERRGWIEARYLPWRDGAGRVAGVAVFLTDVTERRRQALFVHALEAIGHSLRSSLDLNEVLDTIVEKALEVMAAESALVVSWDGRAPELRVMRAAGRLSAEYAVAGSIPVGGGPISRAVMQSRPFATSNILTDPAIRLAPERAAQIGREGFKAVVAAPLLSKGRVHGALVVHYWTERTFTEEETAALMLLAEQAALAIDNARLYADATRRADRLRELVEVERLVAASLDLDEVLSRIAGATARLVEAPVVQVWTADTAARVLRLRAASLQPGTAEVQVPSTIRFGEGIAGRAAEARGPFYVPDVSQDARALSAQWARDSGILRMLVVPILSGEEVLGVLAVRSRSDALSNEENLALITSFAAQAALAIQNARAYTGAVQRARRLRDLVSVSQSISASLDTADVMQRIADAGAALTRGALSAVDLYDADRAVLRAAAVSGPAWEGLPLERPAHAGLPGLVVEQRKPVLVSNPVSHPRTLAPDWWRQRPTATYYGAPIHAGDAFVGVLDYILPDGEPGPEEQEALRLLAAHAGIAIRNASLYREAERRRDVAEALARLGQGLTETLDADRIAELVARGLGDLLHVRSSAVLRYEAADGTLRVVASFGAAGEEVRGLVLQPGEGVVGRAVAERKIVATSDILGESTIYLSDALRERARRLQYRAAVGVPLLAHDRVIGALAIGAEAGREFAADELQTLQAFADHAALALENARLYASARDSLARLHETQARLVQAAKLSALGQLVSGVAHELNNPLSVIIGYGQLLLGRQVPPALQRPVELMVSQADRMAKIVRNLLYFSRQRPPERVPVNLNQVIEPTLALRAHQLTLSGVTVQRDFAPDLPPIAGDPYQLEQVFLNLLLNAEQAILETKRGCGRITLRTRLREGAIEAQVIDDGPGIAPDALPRVFEPFFTTKAVGAGTGLGLSVSYGIVEEHGGRLSVESRPGKTVFTLELPVTAIEARRGPASAPEPSAVQAGGRVALVVEDEASVLDLMVTILTHTGWTVDVAPGGRAALERVRRQRYDLIVSDMRMPEGGGEEFYRSAIVEDVSLRRRFIFVTGDTANPDAWAFLQEAQVPIIEKPFQPALFLDAVRRVTTSLTPEGLGA